MMELHAKYKDLSIYAPHWCDISIRGTNNRHESHVL